MARRNMSLIGLLISGPTSQHHGMWLHPESDNRFFDPAGYEHIARVLEFGCFDALFFTNQMGFSEGPDGDYATLLRRGGQMHLLDPVPIVSMMARVTRHIGLGVTLSSSLYPPYMLARTLATLDILSGGRAAWNVVTTSGTIEAQNCGLDGLPPREVRYDIADEVLEACDALWESWPADALVMDKASGIFADPDKVRRVEYSGKWIKTRGPLTVPQMPQRRPVIMQAGSSERGRQFAARWAEMIFTVQHDKSSMIAFNTDIKRRMVEHGRAPESCAVLAAIDVIIGETESIAREKQEYANSLIHDDMGLALVASHTGIDLSVYPLDEPLAVIETSLGSQGSLDVILQGTRAQGLTLGEAARRYATSELCPQIVGTPRMIADRLIDLFEAEACDGFILNPTVNPGTFEQFTRSVVPLLQEGGFFRKSYQHKTLRETVLSGQ